MLYHHLKKNDKIHFPIDIRERLEEYYLKTSLKNIERLHEFSRILGSAERENISIIALKGLYIAYSIYPNIALRPMYDLDLLIKIDDFQKIHDILRGLDWNCEQEDEELYEYIKKRKEISYTKRSMLLELHFQIIEIVSTDPWKNSHLHKIGSNNVLVLNHDVLLSYMCIHLCEHLRDLFIEIIRIYDIVQILTQSWDDINWDSVIQVAIDNNAKMNVYRVLYYAKNELGIDIPEYVLTKLNEDKPHLTIKQALIRGKKIKEIKPIGHILRKIQEYRFDSNTTTITDVIKYIFSSIFPNKEYMIKKYNPKCKWLFFAYYPIRIASGSIRLLKNLSKNLLKS